MTDCWFCGLKHLRATRRVYLLSSKQYVEKEGNLHYAKHRKNGDRVPVCNDCKNDIEYGAIPEYKMVN